MQKFILGLWITAIAAGFFQLLMYSGTPGPAAIAQFTYPQNSAIQADPKQPSLLIFGHPHCPCSRATIGELERLMPRLKDKVKISVLFVKPEGTTEEWAKEDLWKRAAAIPGVEVVLDQNGIEAAKFGAVTSGQTFLYDRFGALVFRGGITASRGHMGDNLGSDSIATFVENGKVLASFTPVYGCSLRNPERKLAGKASK